MAGRLSTHVLDTVSGRPAAGVRVELHREDGVQVAEVRTNDDGRAMLLTADKMVSGWYRLSFHVGDYFAAAGNGDAGRFLDVVPVLFRIEDVSAGCHVPLLVSPWAYSTYRGS